MCKNLFISFLIIFGFSFGHAEEEALPPDSLKIFSKDFKATGKDKFIVQNMPRVRSQDSLGVCYSYMAASMADYHNCRIMKVQNCAAEPDENIFSGIDVARFGNSPDGELEYESSYRGIADGGPSGHTIEVLTLFVGSSASEACSSLDKILVNLGGAQGLAQPNQQKAFQDLQMLFKEHQKIKEKKKDCADCLSNFYASAKTEIESTFGIQIDQDRMLKVFAEETYEKFFDRLITPKECARAKNRTYFEGKDKMDIDFFPKKIKDKNGKEKLEPVNYERTIAAIKKALKNGPVAVGSICIAPGGHTCKEKKFKDQQHTLLITGIDQFCASKDDCHWGLKVQNSWGEGWQKMMNDGWVSARDLLDSTGYQEQTLVWLKDKPPEK